jgi:hypothetical protein
MKTRVVVGMALLALAIGCETSTEPNGSTRLQFTEISDCEPIEEGCNPRSLTTGEMQTVTGTWVPVYQSKGCSDVLSYFTSGWGERTKMWDEEVTRGGEPLQGDYHHPDHAYFSDEVHVYSGADSPIKTLAHEILHRAHPNWEHSEIRARAAYCSGVPDAHEDDGGV